MFSENLVADDINSKNWRLKRRLRIIIPSCILVIVIVVLIVVLIPKSEEKEENKKEENKKEEKEPYIENIQQYLIADFKLNDNNEIINEGQSNKSSKINNFKTENGYFYGGQMDLNSTYYNGTIIVIAKYNFTSKDRLFTSFAYYGGAIDFKELTSNRQRYIGIAYGGGEIPTNYIFPNHSYLNKYYDGKSLVENEDIFFAVSTNSLNDAQGGKFYVQVNEDYQEKKRWCEYIRKNIKLSPDHRYKEIRVYNTQLPKKNLMEEFEKTGIKINKEIYSIDNFKEVDNGIDNSKYESLHIINKINTLYFGYKYALSAIPYPFEINHSGKSDQYDVNWFSSNESIAQVVDGLVIPKKLGKVTITAKLLRTNIEDSVTIDIIERKKPEKKIRYIQSNYKSKNGNSFSNNNYTMTSQAIFDAIDESFESGYNHVIFPKINFYCHPTGKTYYIPTGMTVEFPEGSKFFMKPSERALNSGYTYFSFGWRTWENGYFYNIPKEKATAEKSEKTGKITGYYIDDAHLIIDKYYGEFYDEKIRIDQLAKNAKSFTDGSILVNFGKFARYCSVELHTANCTSGFFMSMSAKTFKNEIEGNIGISYLDFTKGRINDKGELDSSVSRWFTTNKFFEIGKRFDGTDFYENYVLTNILSSSTLTSYHSNTASTQHLYDIAWYDENKTFISIDRWRYVDENYIRGEGAKFYKISIHQTNPPTIKDCFDNNTYIYFMPAGSSHFCEIKNTKLYHSADGIVSITGETNACWIHDNYIYNDGYLYGWSLDLEDGWNGMRGTILENNIIRKYVFSQRLNSSYTGPDTGNLYLSGGFNTFVISNYIGALIQTNYGTANTHIIHNTIGALFGSHNKTDGKFYELRSKIFAHVYNNVIGLNNYDNIDNSQNGKIYFYDNYYDDIVDTLDWVDSKFIPK